MIHLLIRCAMTLMLCQLLVPSFSWGVGDRCDLLATGYTQWVHIAPFPGEGGLCKLRIQVDTLPQGNVNAYVVEQFLQTPSVDTVALRLMLESNSISLSGIQDGEVVFFELDAMDARGARNQVFTLLRMSATAAKLNPRIIELKFAWPSMFAGRDEDIQTWAMDTNKVRSITLILNQSRQNNGVMTTLKIRQHNEDGTLITHKISQLKNTRAYIVPVEYRLGLIEADTPWVLHDSFSVKF